MRQANAVGPTPIEGSFCSVNRRKQNQSWCILTEVIRNDKRRKMHRLCGVLLVELSELLVVTDKLGKGIRGIRQNFGGGPLNYSVSKGNRRQYQYICWADVAM